MISGSAKRGLLPAAAVALLAAALGVAWLMRGDGEEGFADSLPEPRPPATDPLEAPPGTGLAWSWVNPLPRAMPAWLAVDAGGPERVAFAGRRGEAARFLSDDLYRWRTGTDVTLWGIAWIDDERAVVVGEGGTLRLLGRGEPRVIDTGTGKTLRSVAVLGDGRFVAVGDGGTLLLVQDDRAERVSTPTTADLLDVHPRDDGSALVVGTSGTILRLVDGRVSAEASGSDRTLRAVGACPGEAAYAAGDGGRVLRRGGDGWRALARTGDEPWADLTCDRRRMVVVGRDGGVRLISGRRSVALDSGTDAALHGVSGSSDSLTWLVGDGGRIGMIDRARVRWRTAGPVAPLFDLASLSGAMVAVGGWGTVLRQERGRMRPLDSPTDLALAAAEPLDERRLLAVGDSGALAVITWDAVQMLSSPVGSGWRDLVTAEGRALAVGVDGALLRGGPGAWRASRIPEAGTLWAVAGTPDDAVAVGDGGTIVHIDPGGSRRTECGETGTLRGVARLDDETWIVGDGGVVLRLGDDGCEVEHRAEADLYAVGAGPRGDPIAVGRGGAVIEREPDGTWSSVALDTNRAHLRTVVRTARYVYVAGSGGVILRHPRID